MKQWARLVIATGLLCTPGFARSAPVNPDVGQVKREVLDRVHGVIAALNAHDVAATRAAVLAADAPDLVVMNHGQAVQRGIAPDLETALQSVADPKSSTTLGDESVDVAASGDLAVYHASYRISFTDPASKRVLVENGQWIAVYKRQSDGSMKMAWDIAADTPAPVDGHH